MDKNNPFPRHPSAPSCHPGAPLPASWHTGVPSSDFWQSEVPSATFWHSGVPSSSSFIPEPLCLRLSWGYVKSIICRHLSCAPFCHSEAASRRVSPPKERLVSNGGPSPFGFRMTGMGKRYLNNNFDFTHPHLLSTKGASFPHSVIPRLTRDLRSSKGGFKAGRGRVVARHDKNRRRDAGMTAVGEKAPIRLICQG